MQKYLIVCLESMLLAFFQLNVYSNNVYALSGNTFIIYRSSLHVLCFIYSNIILKMFNPQLFCFAKLHMFKQLNSYFCLK